MVVEHGNAHHNATGHLLRWSVTREVTFRRPLDRRRNAVESVCMRYRPSRASIHRVSIAGIIPPTLLDVQSDGSTIAYYGEQPLVQFRSLDAALRYHRMTQDDLEDVG